MGALLRGHSRAIARPGAPSHSAPKGPTIHFISARLLDNGVLERKFTLRDVPGILWTPVSGPTPLILMGHPGGLDRMYPRLVSGALSAAAQGFSSATIELPGCGDRPSSAGMNRARAELQRALQAGEPVTAEMVDRLVLPLVEHSVPEWQATMDHLLAEPEITGPVGYSGGNISVGTRLVAVEPRISAAVLFAGSVVPRAVFEDARRVAIPPHVLLQWDDEHNDRQMSLDLFDAFGSTEKTVHANMGGYTGVPEFAGEEANRFFTRHFAWTQPASLASPG